MDSNNDKPISDRYTEGYVCCLVTILRMQGFDLIIKEAFYAGPGTLQKCIDAGVPANDIEELKKHFL